MSKKCPDRKYYKIENLGHPQIMVGAYTHVENSFELSQSFENQSSPQVVELILFLFLYDFRYFYLHEMIQRKAVLQKETSREELEPRGTNSPLLFLCP